MDFIKRVKYGGARVINERYIVYRTNVSASVPLSILKLVELCVSTIEYVQVVKNVEGVRYATTIEYVHVVKNVEGVRYATTIEYVHVVKNVEEVLYVNTIENAPDVYHAVDLKYVITIE